MPGIVRVELDKHIGHAKAKVPYHQTPYKIGSPNVYVNGQPAVRIGDSTFCNDKAAEGSTTVFVNNIGVHRFGDKTTGHDGWVANKAATGSSNVIAG